LADFAAVRPEEILLGKKGLIWGKALTQGYFIINHLVNSFFLWFNQEMVWENYFLPNLEAGRIG